MAKTIEQHKEDIQRRREKIKTLEAEIKKTEATIMQLEEAELMSFARQLRAAGKLQDAKKLLAGSTGQIEGPAVVQTAASNNAAVSD